MLLFGENDPYRYVNCQLLSISESIMYISQYNGSISNFITIQHTIHNAIKGLVPLHWGVLPCFKPLHLTHGRMLYTQMHTDAKFTHITIGYVL